MPVIYTHALDVVVDIDTGEVAGRFQEPLEGFAAIAATLGAIFFGGGDGLVGRGREGN